MSAAISVRSRCTRFDVASWLLLAGAAGAVNGFAFVMCRQYVTHISGTFTQIGLESNRLELAAKSAALVLSFILGAFTSSLAFRGASGATRRQSWTIPLLVVATLLIALAVTGRSGAFGTFGTEATLDIRVVVLLAVLSYAMGLQNAVVTLATDPAVRTTHVTGPATELGIQLGAAVRASGRERREAVRAASLRAGKIFTFALGAALSMPLARSTGYLALLEPAFCIILATLIGGRSRGPGLTVVDLQAA
ncbi:hypothetical protein Pan44_53180 [Caulifigura coniformis]|uniref:DUF1275 domain-containing protein n=1 Tax=Caulifigura coniformis TaxID=2527983 RepID=A0A517SM92_9PLAN|nr:YoaK family protein [Caulifigura coniformis]QDT57250.1 hypothetical protein Pan44_53180 [Caulifigura coniformis]